MSDRTNSIPKPLKDAIKLGKDMERTRQLRATCSQLKHSTEERIRELEQERVAAYTRAARGNRKGKEDAAKIEAQLDEARRRIESADAEIAGALKAEQQITDELEELLKRELPTFVDDAEDETQDAIEAVDELEKAYREAHAAWGQAAGKWAPLRSAVYQMFKLKTEQDGFYLPEAELMAAANVPPWPFPQPDELFPPTRAPRPPAFEQPPEPEPDELEPDDEEEDE